MKNCGEHVHSQIVERNILGEMIKIVKKKVSLKDIGASFCSSGAIFFGSYV